MSACCRASASRRWPRRCRRSLGNHLTKWRRRVRTYILPVLGTWGCDPISKTSVTSFPTRVRRGTPFSEYHLNGSQLPPPRDAGRSGIRRCILVNDPRKSRRLHRPSELAQVLRRSLLEISDRIEGNARAKRFHLLPTFKRSTIAWPMASPTFIYVSAFPP